MIATQEDRRFESLSLQRGVGRTSDHDKAQVEIAALIIECFRNRHIALALVTRVHLECAITIES
jgi:hypothetical protein